MDWARQSHKIDISSKYRLSFGTSFTYKYMLLKELCEGAWQFIAATAEFIRNVMIALWDLAHYRDPFKQQSIRLLNEKLETEKLKLDIRADAYMSLAYLHAEQGYNKPVQTFFRRAHAGYNLAISEEKRGVEAWKKEPSPWTKLGILLSAPLYDGHDLKAAYDVFEAAVKAHGCQHAVYWKGRALLNGFGIDRDVLLGFNLIQKAAGSGVLRAKLEVAALLEEGCDGIRKNPSLAEEYYRAISLTPRGKETVKVESLDYKTIFEENPSQLDAAVPIDTDLAKQEWVRDFALSHLLKVTELLDTEDRMGQNNGSLLSWEFAGQAFLFAAAASLASSSFLNDSEVFDLLTHLLPILGIAIGILSFFSSCSAALKNAFRRHDMESMFEAKVHACDRLVAGPSLSKFRWESGVLLQAALAKFSDGCAVGLSLLFIGVWTKLYIEWEY